MTTATQPRVLALGITAAAWALLAPSLPAQDHGDPTAPGFPPGAMIQEDAASKPAAADSASTYRLAMAPQAGTRKAAPGRNRAEAAKAETAKAETAKEAPKAEAPKPGEPSFARDVAPILVANCVGCHSPGRPGSSRGKLDMTSFEKFQKGGTSGDVFEEGKPEESHLILRVTGEETPLMPQGGNGDRLGAPAIDAMKAWVKAGAKLDAGLDPKAPLKSYAASLADVARAQTAKLSPEERDAKVKETGLERWKKANPALKPEIETSEHFALFSTLPSDRSTKLVKSMENSLATVRRAVGTEATDWPEKVGLYVFADRKDYVEFPRTIKQREVDEEEEGDADLKTTQPYVVVYSPADAPTETSAAAPRRKGRGRQADAADANLRSTSSLLTENLTRGAAAAAGAPRWLAEGLGNVVGGGPTRKLRMNALEAYRRGWLTKATEVLGGGGDNVSPDEFRGVSFGLVECLTSPAFRRVFPQFLKEMSKRGGAKLDDVVKDVYGVNREAFLNQTGEWIASSYGGAQ